MRPGIGGRLSQAKHSVPVRTTFALAEVTLAACSTSVTAALRTGGLSFVAFILFELWLLTTSILLIRRVERHTLAAAVT